MNSKLSADSLQSLTVIIPTYNHGGVLARALQSIAWAKQVIIADGGSTDETLTVAQKHERDILILMDVPNPAIRVQMALEQVAHPWVLLLQPHEWVSDAFKHEITGLLLDSSMKTQVFRVRCQPHRNGKPLTYGYWRLARPPVRLFQPAYITIEESHGVNPVREKRGNAPHPPHHLHPDPELPPASDLLDELEEDVESIAEATHPHPLVTVTTADHPLGYDLGPTFHQALLNAAHQGQWQGYEDIQNQVTPYPMVSFGSMMMTKWQLLVSAVVSLGICDGFAGIEQVWLDAITTLTRWNTRAQLAEGAELEGRDT